MSDQIIALQWEWPANRHLKTKVLVNVQKISKPSKGLLGIDDSPSLANTLPDAHDVKAIVISGMPDMVGKVISIRVPGVEARKLNEGTQAAIALINQNTGICIAPVPSSVQNSQAWLEQWNCP